MGRLSLRIPLPFSDNNGRFLKFRSKYGPEVSEDILLKLINAFGELRAMSDAGTFLYPYSTRELVNIVKHMQV